MRVDVAHLAVKGMFIVGTPMCGVGSLSDSPVRIVLCDKVSPDRSECSHGGTFEGAASMFEAAYPHVFLKEGECPIPSCHTHLPEPPDGSVVVDEDGLAWQRNDEASWAGDPRKRWQAASDEDDEMTWDRLRTCSPRTVYVPAEGTVSE